MHKYQLNAYAFPLLLKIGVSSQNILALRHQLEFPEDTVKLVNLVLKAEQLIPNKESGQNPYRDILYAINDYQEWGMPLQAAELHDLIVRYETENTLHYWLSAAEAARLRGNVDGADEMLTTAKRMWPYERILHQRHGSLLMQDNRWAEAIMAGHEWLTYFPNDGRAMYQIGQAYYRSGEYDMAIEWLMDALDNLPVNERYVRAAIESTLLKIAEQKND